MLKSRKILVMAIIFQVSTHVHGWGSGSGPDVDERERSEKKKVFHDLYKNLTEECFVPGRICLLGGERTSGTVLLGGWPVCHEDGDIKEADVACRSLGFTGATNATRSSDFYIEQGKCR